MHFIDIYTVIPLPEQWLLVGVSSEALNIAKKGRATVYHQETVWRLSPGVRGWRIFGGIAGAECGISAGLQCGYFCDGR